MPLAIAFAFLAAAGFASGIIFVRLGIQRVSPPTAAAISVVVGASMAMSLALALNLAEFRGLSGPSFAWFALLGVLGVPVARLLNYTAISAVGASRVAPVVSVQPLFAAGLAMAVLGERPNLQVGLGTLVIVCGLGLVVTARTGTTETPSRKVINRLGYLAAVGAAAAFASRDVIGRHVVAETVPPLIAAAFALLIGGSILVVMAHRNVIRNFSQAPPRYLGICALAGICQGIGTISVFQAISRAPVTVVNPLIASSPLIILVLAHFFLQRLETITPRLVLGTLFSVGGVILVILGATT